MLMYNVCLGVVMYFAYHYVNVRCCMNAWLNFMNGRAAVPSVEERESCAWRHPPKSLSGLVRRVSNQLHLKSSARTVLSTEFIFNQYQESQLSNRNHVYLPSHSESVLITYQSRSMDPRGFIGKYYIVV